MRRSGTLLVAGLVAGLLGAALVMSYVKSVERRAATQGADVRVLVATEEIPAGTPGAEVTGRVESRAMPSRFAPPGFVAEAGALRGLVALERVAAGETLTSSQFGAAGRTRGPLAIPRGKEAMAISIALDAGLASYVRPGDRVSVFATFTEARTRFTRKILSSVEVLGTSAEPAARQGVAPAGGAPFTVVLAVTPAQAADLVFAKEAGSVWLTLVPQGQDSGPAPTVTVARAGRAAGGER